MLLYKKLLLMTFRTTLVLGIKAIAAYSANRMKSIVGRMQRLLQQVVVITVP